MWGGTRVNWASIAAKELEQGSAGWIEGGASGTTYLDRATFRARGTLGRPLGALVGHAQSLILRGWVFVEVEVSVLSAGVFQVRRQPPTQDDLDKIGNKPRRSTR